VLDVVMTEVGLRRPRVMAGISEGEAAGAPQHVRMRLEVESGGGSSTLDHLAEAGRREGANCARSRTRMTKASMHRDFANCAMALDGATLEESSIRSSGWVLAYENRSVSGFEVVVDGRAAPATWSQRESPDIAEVMRNAPGSGRARFELSSDLRVVPRRNSAGTIRATLSDGSRAFSMFPISSDLPLPDERMAGMVGGMFTQVGFSMLGLLIEFGGLRPDEVVLDAGCGCGRIAYGLAHYLSEKGAYIGFDVMKDHIGWARDVLARDLPQFSFIHADIVNQEYNPAGTIQSTTYRFPSENHSVDICIAISLYTHLLKDDFKHYINETARVLKKGGRSFMTTFTMTEEARRSIGAGAAHLDIRHPIGQEGFFTSRPDLPEAVIGIEERMLFDWVAEAGLSVERFYPGWWANKNAPSYQDILVLRKS
jgi:SAM-dependent methyltransferase